MAMWVWNLNTHGYNIMKLPSPTEYTFTVFFPDDWSFVYYVDCGDDSG